MIFHALFVAVLRGRATCFNQEFVVAGLEVMRVQVGSSLKSTAGENVVYIDLMRDSAVRGPRVGDRRSTLVKLHLKR